MKTRVKELREEKDITQLFLSIKVGCSQNTISKVELELTEPKASLIVALADYFNVSTDYLLYHSEIKRKSEIVLDLIKFSEEFTDFVMNYRKLNNVNRETIKMLTEYFVRHQNNE